jgi:hypothetical protein
LEFALHTIIREWFNPSTEIIVGFAGTAAAPLHGNDVVTADLDVEVPRTVATATM